MSERKETGFKLDPWMKCLPAEIWVSAKLGSKFSLAICRFIEMSYRKGAGEDIPVTKFVENWNDLKGSFDLPQDQILSLILSAEGEDRETESDCCPLEG